MRSAWSSRRSASREGSFIAPAAGSAPAGPPPMRLRRIRPPRPRPRLLRRRRRRRPLAPAIPLGPSR
ncbi:hypothetical protein H696_04207 [Fonticula alba]|uniref:Uncharacterized protein n=1 Tax=Fonticula alba TaxID=691883 RepID=A0A058Z4D5_FONAL|nr:hypothetical protein H696_04207 [Fonticula alba]KCV68788.1 hypothetical protein H696_04207 [Fonticula alba]|eukprot:XP_009496359.1 hypothetical protein H696_04207 [Fonticula alba]